MEVMEKIDSWIIENLESLLDFIWEWTGIEQPMIEKYLLRLYVVTTALGCLGYVFGVFFLAPLQGFVGWQRYKSNKKEIEYVQEERRIGRYLDVSLRMFLNMVLVPLVLLNLMPIKGLAFRFGYAFVTISYIVSALISYVVVCFVEGYRVRERKSLRFWVHTPVTA